MSRRSVWLVHLVIAIVVGGSLYVAVTARECWPFSPYPMYAWIEQDRSVQRLQLYGVVAGRPDEEFPLRALRHLRPFDDARLTAALGRLWHRADAPQALDQALRYCLTRYEQLRRQGRHTGPALRGIRLYVLEWKQTDPWARDADQPDYRELVIEVQSAADGLANARLE